MLLTMLLSSALLVLSSLAAASPLAVLHPPGLDQVVFGHFGPEEKALNEAQELILARLRLGEVIPTVLDEFRPLVSVAASWGTKANATLGNTVKPKKLKRAPDVALSLLTEGGADVVYEQFVAVLTDPDAKARDDPKWAEMCHWIAYWPAAAKGAGGGGNDRTRRKDVVEYMAPAPPKGTWKHRYVLVVLTPLNGTREELHLAAPRERQRWGYGGVREGVRRWAGENGLGVVGANYVMAMNKKQ